MTSSYKASWCRPGYYISLTILLLVVPWTLWLIGKPMEIGKKHNPLTACSMAEQIYPLTFKGRESKPRMLGGSGVLNTPLLPCMWQIFKSPKYMLIWSWRSLSSRKFSEWNFNMESKNWATYEDTDKGPLHSWTLNYSVTTNTNNSNLRLYSCSLHYSFSLTSCLTVKLIKSRDMIKNCSTNIICLITLLVH